LPAASKLSKDIFGVFSARAVWTVLGTIIGVILARRLGPDDRGIFALFLLVPSTVVTFVKLGITQANVYFINREKISSSTVASNSSFNVTPNPGPSGTVIHPFSACRFSSVS